MRNKHIKENNYFILDRPYKRTLCGTMKTFAKRILAIKYKLNILTAKKVITLKKYNVTICAIFKDEADTLKEWIEYHLIVGIEHFYMYNNESTDDYRTVLDPYVQRGIVTLIDWPGRQMQIAAYENCIDKYREESQWIGFIDLDEFVVPLKNNTVGEFLQNFINYPSVLIYWKVFGTSGLIERKLDELIIEQFYMAFPKMNDIGKCFYNTSFIFAKDYQNNSILHHILWCVDRNRLMPPVNCEKKVSFSNYHRLTRADVPIQINHYVTKSYSDYYRKTYEKTDVYYSKNPRKMEKIFDIDRHCCSIDKKIFRFITELKVHLQQADKNG